MSPPPLTVYNRMKNDLKALSTNRPTCVTTIPPQFDTLPNDAVHCDIALTNIRELILRLNNVYLIELDLFKRYHFYHQGMHLSYKGKKMLAFKIIEFVQNSYTKERVIREDTVAIGIKRMLKT